MADSTITNLTAKTSLTGTEEVPLNDSLTDKKATISNVRGGATQTELGYLTGVTSAIQTQIDKQRVIIKTSNESVTSDDTLSNDAELLFSVAASTRYVGFVMLFGVTGTVPDFKFTFTLPSGASGNKVFAAWNTGTQSFSEDITTTRAVVGVAGNFFLPISFEISVGATAGNVVLQWAQNTSDTTATAVNAGSHIIVMRV